jgi:hypothetical protein
MMEYEEGGEVPGGMDAEVFREIYDEFVGEADRVEGAKEKKLIENLTHKTVTKVQADRSCSICMADYKKKDKVVFLGCKHHFHSDCVKPWFEKAHNCPVCRFDINLNLPADKAKEK